MIETIGEREIGTEEKKETKGTEGKNAGRRNETV